MKLSPRSSGGVVPLLLVLAGCGDPTGTVPGPLRPPDPLIIQRTTTWSASEPQLRQTGEFFYDAEGRLARYEFSHNGGGELRTTIKKEFLYRDDGSIWGWDHFLRQPDGSWRLTRIVRYGYDTERRLPVEIHMEEIDERTGAVVVSTAGIGYNASGQIVEERFGTESLRYTYDRRGNVTKVRADDIRFPPPRVQTTSYSEAWNPFADFPPRLDVERGFAPETYSLQLSNEWENALEGRPAAARATAVIQTNAQGYPVRREYTIWNTSEPDLRTVLVTEYEYLPPGS